MTAGVRASAVTKIRGRRLNDLIEISANRAVQVLLFDSARSICRAARLRRFPICRNRLLSAQKRKLAESARCSRKQTFNAGIQRRSARMNPEASPSRSQPEEELTQLGI